MLSCLPQQIVVKLAYWMDRALRNVQDSEIWIRIRLKNVHRRLTYHHPLVIDECFLCVHCWVYVDLPKHSIQKPKTELIVYLAHTSKFNHILNIIDIISISNEGLIIPLEYHSYTLDKFYVPEAMDQHMFYEIYA